LADEAQRVSLNGFLAEIKLSSKKRKDFNVVHRAFLISVKNTLCYLMKCCLYAHIVIGARKSSHEYVLFPHVFRVWQQPTRMKQSVAIEHCVPLLINLAYV